MRLARDVLTVEQRLDPSRWSPPVLDDGMASIDAWQGPWSRRVDDLTVDTKRSEMLAAFDVPCRVQGGTAPWQGTSPGHPWNVVGAKSPVVSVWNLSRPVVWEWFNAILPIERVALPDLVLREGDPLGSSDLGAIAINPGVELVEMIAFEQRNTLQLLGLAPLAVLNGVNVTCGYPSNGRGLYRYDLRKPWSKTLGGRTAANVPLSPFIIRGDELTAGQINHALFAALPNYSPDRPVGMASSTDGTWPGHPLRAGDILRLPASLIDRYRPGTKEHTVAVAAHQHGVVIGDKTTLGDPTSGPMTVACALDRRVGTIDLALSLSDFEVVTQ